MLTLSQRERDRLAVLHQVRDGLITAREGADRLGLSVRHLRRMRRAWERGGDAVLVHGLRGRRSNRAKPAELRAWVLERARNPLYHDFGPTLLSEHLGRDPQAPGTVQAATLRLWLIAEGIWTPKQKRARHRKARARRAAFGELIQWDSSEHAWFEKRGPRCTLIQMHDDATNRLLIARFVARDSGAANRQAAIDYLRRYGRPVAFYTDKAGHFGQWTRPASRVPLEEREIQRTESIIRAGLAELGVELIQAHSPQAKGRVERDFGTSQDRLVKELRVTGISTLEEGNRFLEEVYLGYWNERFAVQAAERKDAHRPLPRRSDLERLFAETWTRTVARDFTVRFKNQRFQISKPQARRIQPGDKLTIELRLDASTRFRFNGRYLKLEPLCSCDPRHPERPRARSAAAPPPAPRPRPVPIPPRPGPDHPWRQNGRLLAKPALIVRLRSTPAAPRPALSTPPPLEES